MSTYAHRKSVNPDRIRRDNRRLALAKRGMTEVSYETLLASQGGRCAVCGTTDPGGRGQWHIDHDHSCCPAGSRNCENCVMALLCHLCNITLSEHLVANLPKFLGYLERKRNKQLAAASGK